VDVPDDLVIEADRVRLEQALGNMVENALRHGAGTVALGARYAELSVRDDGPGFPPEFIPRAFERFSRAAPGRNGSGAGLGLTIVDTIARAHHWEATVANAPAGGAQVTIRLSRGRADEPG
jgi:signal transduction histidine kinase